MQVTADEYVSELRTNAYRRVHERIVRTHGPASLYLCDGCCGNTAAEWANVHGTNTYVTLCVKCHQHYDHPRETCPSGHNVNRFGRAPDGACRVCKRLASYNARLRGLNCQHCGYRHCKC